MTGVQTCALPIWLAFHHKPDRKMGNHDHEKKLFITSGRWAGKLSPSSVVAGAGGAYIGASMLGPIGAVIAPAVGGAAKYGATRMGLADFNRLQGMMALGRQPQVTRAPFEAVPATTLRGLLSTPTE